MIFTEIHRILFAVKTCTVKIKEIDRCLTGRASTSMKNWDAAGESGIRLESATGNRLRRRNIEYTVSSGKPTRDLITTCTGSAAEGL